MPESEALEGEVGAERGTGASRVGEVGPERPAHEVGMSGGLEQANWMPRSRLGVVLLLPEPWATEIDGIRRACGDSSLTRIAAHVTVIPPINVNHEQIDEVIATVRTGAASHSPLELRLLGAATFLPHNPVAYLQVVGDVDRLAQLRSEMALGPLERPDPHPYTAHVTIAYEAAEPRLAAIVTALCDYSADITFDRLHVLRFDDDRMWRPLADARFAASRVIGRGGLPLSVTVTELATGRQGSWAVTARRDGRVVGEAAGYVHGDRCVINSFTVVHRGEGIGTHLAVAVEDLARERECARIVQVGDDSTAGFWRARGWSDGVRSLVRTLRWAD
jgi:2'-5' RNA ligase